MKRRPILTYTCPKNNLNLQISDSPLQVVRQLGRGSFGKIQLLHNKQQHKLYVVKSMISKNTKSTILKQYQIMRKLQVFNCKNIPRIISQNSSMFYMQALSLTLSDICRKAGGKLHLGIISYMALHILKAIKCLISLNLSHRDIKPDNILIDINHQFKLIDYGLCAQFNNYNNKQGMVGSARYASLSAHSRNWHKGSDIQSLVYVMIQMGKGYLPWQCSLQHYDINLIWKRAQNGKIKKAQQIIGQQLYGQNKSWWQIIANLLNYLRDNEHVQYKVVKQRFKQLQQQQNYNFCQKDCWHCFFKQKL